MAAPTEAPEIPDKLFFRIGEVSRIAGVPSSVLRFWESQFSNIKPKRTEAGQRLYRKSDVALILTIKHLLYDQRFTIKGARRYLKTIGDDPAFDAPGSEEKALLRDIRRELAAIRDMLA
jgi:DNA-binding transcriptional MerR regulator